MLLFKEQSRKSNHPSRSAGNTVAGRDCEHLADPYFLRGPVAAPVLVFSATDRRIPAKRIERESRGQW